MSNLVQWDPFSELRTTMDRLFDQGFARPWRMLSTSDYEHGMSADISERSESFEIVAALPGIQPDNVDISVAGDQVTIKAHTDDAQQDGKTYHYREIRYGDFTRTFSLPASVEAEKATAHYEHGMLYLTLPKVESVRPKQIRLTGGNGNPQLN